MKLLDKQYYLKLIDALGMIGQYCNRITTKYNYLDDL